VAISEERADRIFKALGALEAGLIALEKQKTDRTESGALASQYIALKEAKADRVDLVRLQQALTDDLHKTVADLQERIADKFNATNSRILDMQAKLDALGGRLAAMAEADTRRGAEISRVGDALSDLSRLIAEQAEAARAEKANRWKRWGRLAHLLLQYGFQTAAGLYILAMLLNEGVTSLPKALDLFAKAFGFQ
jgi:hypothetical protein